MPYSKYNNIYICHRYLLEYSSITYTCTTRVFNIHIKKKHNLCCSSYRYCNMDSQYLPGYRGTPRYTRVHTCINMAYYCNTRVYGTRVRARAIHTSVAFYPGTRVPVLEYRGTGTVRFVLLYLFILPFYQVAYATGMAMHITIPVFNGCHGGVTDQCMHQVHSILQLRSRSTAGRRSPIPEARV